MIVINMTPEQIGQAIRTRRKQVGLTQTQLAELAGCTQPFVVVAELGKPTLRLDKLMDVLRVLGLTLTVQDAERDSDAGR